jgi:hypothetical protein
MTVETEGSLRTVAQDGCNGVSRESIPADQDIQHSARRTVSRGRRP